MVEEELLVQQAQRDTNIKVTDREVQDQVEQTVQNVRKQFTSGAEFQSQLRAAGFGSEEEWRRWLADNQRRSILRDRLLDELRQKGKLRPIPPSEAQLRTFWEQNRSQQSKRPASVSFRQIVIAPKPDSTAKARARQLAESLVVALRGGADFADVARRFSSDSGSREAGGELGWFRRGRMVKEFEDVAFRMRPGDISGVVETEFGYHIIQVERVQPAEVEARHVLLAPVISAAQLALARRLADSGHDAVASGAAGPPRLRGHPRLAPWPRGRASPSPWATRGGSGRRWWRRPFPWGRSPRTSSCSGAGSGERNPPLHHPLPLPAPCSRKGRAGSPGRRSGGRCGPPPAAGATPSSR